MAFVARTESTPALAQLLDSIHTAAAAERDSGRVANQVAERLQPFLADPNLLTREQREADPTRYRQHVLHVAEDGSFSVVALVWLPGQATPIHDHVSWCVVGVYEGQESETRYRWEHNDGSRRLVEVDRSINLTGSVAALTPPGDIHRVTNRGQGLAISLHIYGADIARLGSSIRRCYEEP